MNEERLKRWQVWLEDTKVLRRDFKRGQITVFIILGIIVLALTLLIFATYSKYSTQEISASESGVLDASNLAGPVKSYVENCLEKTVEKAILENGRKGGYFYLPDVSTTDEPEDLPYYVYHSQSFVPTKESFEKELEAYLDFFLKFCPDWSSFPEYNVSYGAPTSSVSIGVNRIQVKTKFPLTLSSGSTLRELSDFEATIEDKQLYSNIASLSVVLNYSEKGFCASCLMEVADEKDWNIEILSWGNSTYKFKITDESYWLSSEPYTLNFMVNYE